MSAAPSLSPSSGAISDLEALLTRMRQRLYPETIPVLGSCWFKTICASGHNPRWWKELSHLLREVLRERTLNAPSRQALLEIQAEVQEIQLRTDKTSALLPPRLAPFRANLRKEWLAPYIARLLNEWLTAEVAYLLSGENESNIAQNEGIPVLAIGQALERLLIRERLSPETLEMLLWPDTLSPEHVYPADAEMLIDVVLALLGRTSAPAPPVMPATLLGVAAGSALPPDYTEMVRHASVVTSRAGEELQVPLAKAQALEILKGDPVRIGSVILTMDGRWWLPENLQSGEQHAVVYKPGGRLQIDYSADHARLDVPWPEPQLHWSGSVHLQGPFQVFGREWCASSWETDAERTMLRLVFSRTLPIAEIHPTPDTRLRRSHPASVDMAWAALESALAASFSQKSRNSIEQLHHSELIPVGRAIFRMMELLQADRQPGIGAIETQLKAIRFLEAEVASVYGLVPWRVLPASVQAIFLKSPAAPPLRRLLNEVFDGAPETHSDQPRVRLLSRTRHVKPPDRKPC